MALRSVRPGKARGIIALTNFQSPRRSLHRREPNREGNGLRNFQGRAEKMLLSCCIAENINASAGSCLAARLR